MSSNVSRSSSTSAFKKSTSSSSSCSPRERKERLRAVLAKTETLHVCHPQTVFSLEELFREVDAINSEATLDEKASCQDEVLIDSRVMTASSKLLKAGTAALAKEISPYDSCGFAEKLVSYTCSLPDTTMAKPNWSMLEDEVSKMFKRTPNYSTLSGCLDPLEKKVIVKRQQITRDALAPTRRPEAVVDVSKTEDSVEETVKKILKLIKEHCKTAGKPLEFVRLILHPTDFGKTIQNMLHVSFLVRDGLVKMIMDDDELYVLPVTKAMKTELEKSGSSSNVQNVVSLNVQQWQSLVAVFEIKTPMINFNEDSSNN